MSKRQNKNKQQISDPVSEGPRIGVYVCHCGGNISDIVNIKRVVDVATKLPNVAVCRDYTAMCSDLGQGLIVEDIAKHKLNRVVVAACSPSLHELTFRRTLVRSGLNPYLYEHANIREQVSWCSKSDPEGATEKATHLVMAAVAKARLLQPLEPIRVEAAKHVAVIGAGVAGLHCAEQLSRFGLRVTLLERSAFMGGRMAQLDRVYPTEDKSRELLEGLLDKVNAASNITPYTLAEVTAASGYLGSFNLKVLIHQRGVTDQIEPDKIQAAIRVCPESTGNEFDYNLSQRKAIYLPYEGCNPPIPAIDWETCSRCGKCVEAAGDKAIKLDEQAEEINLDVGVIVLATGFDLYQPHQDEYGYGEHSEVITLAQLIRLMDEQGPNGGKLTLADRDVRNVCMIHCVGSRQVEGIHKPRPDGRINDYCSRVCCTATLQAANDIRERFSDVNVFEFYQDIRTYGRGHEEYYENASKRGVLFFRYKPEEPPVLVRATTQNGSQLFVKVKDGLTFDEELEVPADMVVLSTGMVPRDISGLIDMLKLPRSAEGFLQEVHPKLRPVETSVNGVLIAGSCQGPMDITESCAAAGATAAKAAVLLSKDHIDMDPFVAKVDIGKCTGGDGCGTACVQECKFMRAISIVEQSVEGLGRKVAEVNGVLCTGCGMCVAVCPYQAIQVQGWRIDQFEAMVDAIISDYHISKGDDETE